VAPPVPAARAHRRDGARVPAGVPGYVSKHQQAAWVAAALAEVRTRGRGGGCSTVSPPHGPREDGLTHPADTSRSNHAAVLGVLLRWRLPKPSLALSLTHPLSRHHQVDPNDPRNRRLMDALHTRQTFTAAGTQFRLQLEEDLQLGGPAGTQTESKRAQLMKERWQHNVQLKLPVPLLEADVDDRLLDKVMRLKRTKSGTAAAFYTKSKLCSFPLLEQVRARRRCLAVQSGSAPSAAAG
jgi:hypothetical protein